MFFCWSFFKEQRNASPTRSGAKDANLAGGVCFILLESALHALDQAVNVPEHVQVADPFAVKSKDWHAGPPNVSTAWWHTEHLHLVVAVKSHLAADAIVLLDQGQDVCGVVAEGSSHPIDVTSELIVADQRRPKRTAEGKVRMENAGDQT